MNKSDIIKKTQEHIDSLVKYRFNDSEVNYCKEIQNQRIEYREIWNKKYPKLEVSNNKISRWHSDNELWWGLLCELLLCREFGKNVYPNEPQRILKNWAEDQRRQNTQLLKEGHFDCKDVGHTQVRAAEHSDEELRRLIYRENDFRSKSTQPVVACVINTHSKDLWAVICGFMSWNDLKDRRQEFWDDPDRRGYPAMFIPYWNLTSMDKFDINELKEKI